MTSWEDPRLGKLAFETLVDDVGENLFDHTMVASWMSSPSMTC